MKESTRSEFFKRVVYIPIKLKYPSHSLLNGEGYFGLLAGNRKIHSQIRFARGESENPLANSVCSRGIEKSTRKFGLLAGNQKIHSQIRFAHGKSRNPLANSVCSRGIGKSTRKFGLLAGNQKSHSQIRFTYTKSENKLIKLKILIKLLFRVRQMI